jgi:hypothetical protein
MARLRYVVVSDMHAGADLSLATNIAPDGTRNDPDQPSPVSAAFGQAVRALTMRHAAGDPSAAPPTVLLLGDIMDLAFCDRNDAAQSYVGWLKGLIGDTPASFAADVVYLPGNHDHSLWTAARMAAETASVAAGREAYMPLSTPATAEQPLISAFVTALNRRAGLNGDAYLHYPNFALHEGSTGRCVAFHHGHFLEGTYRAMSTAHDMFTGVARPQLTAAELADENANWIDFGWSSFGQTSDLSRDLMALYSGLAVASESHHLRQRMARAIANHLGPKLPMGGQNRMKTTLRYGILAALDASLGAYADEERASISHALSDSGAAGLRAYLDGPLAGQLRNELGHIPPELTFVFGHTHKPFVDTVVPAKGPVVQVCNTGGWYLDSPRLNGREGVSLVLVDDALNVVSVRCFATPTNGQCCPVEVRLASHHAPDGEAFAANIAACVAADQPVWAALSQVAAAEYLVRQNLLLSLLRQSDQNAHETKGVL